MRLLVNLTVVVVLVMAVGAAWCQEEGLVAYYSFDEGSGSVAHDQSGNGNDGEIRDARFVKTASGHCLEFNGETSLVDCGNAPSLDLREAITLEAWVFPGSRATGEPGILGKQFGSYLITYYSNGQCYWYIGSGGNNTRVPLPVGVWHHIATTFDGKTLSLYLNGRLAQSRPSKFPTIPPGGRFLIGAVAGDSSATDPNYTHTAHFLGLIDEVRVYSRVLSAEEVASHAQADLPNFEMTQPCERVHGVKAIGAGGLRVKIGQRGKLQVDAAGESYLIESSYSYPGDEIGWNSLGRGEAQSEDTWEPRATRQSRMSAQVAARGRSYSLRRQVAINGGLVTIEDTITNLSGEAIGLMVRNNVTSRRRFRSSVAPGGPENPTLFVEGSRGNLGIVLEDNVSRLQYQPVTGLRTNQVSIRLRNLGLDAGNSLTLLWTLYPLGKDEGYFDFINKLRRKWKTNFTVEGPFDWIATNSPLLDKPDELKAYLTRKRVKLMALVPWLDYDPGREDHVWPRDQYKAYARRAIKALKAADPDILCLGCIETDWVTIYPERIPDGDKLPVAGKGGGGLSHEQTRIIDAANLPWADSVKRYANGTLRLELYMRGGKPQTALSVYPAVGNYQYEFLMDQVKFLFDEVGADGYYIDEFSQSWTDGIRAYDGWDGQSVELDPKTGRIKHKFIGCGLAGVEARVRLCQYALDRGKVVVANTYATAMDEQALPVNRFSETQGAFDPMATEDGARPPGLAALFRSNLASPIGLGIIGDSAKHDTARRLMKAIVTYLRHGMVYYHYAIGDIPETGEGSGEYGPINHMFPITPVELHEGWIVGQERTITCVSGSYQWMGPGQPQVLLFDLDGRQQPNEADIRREGDTWIVDLNLRDWAEIAVIEGSGP